MTENPHNPPYVTIAEVCSRTLAIYRRGQPIDNRGHSVVLRREDPIHWPNSLHPVWHNKGGITMAAVPYNVAEAFVRGDNLRRGAFQSINGDLYSYGLKLAHREPNGEIVLDHDLNDHRSATTARHIKALQVILQGYTMCIHCGRLIDKDAVNKDTHPMCRVREQINGIRTEESPAYRQQMRDAGRGGLLR